MIVCGSYLSQNCNIFWVLCGDTKLLQFFCCQYVDNVWELFALLDLWETWNIKINRPIFEIMVWKAWMKARVLETDRKVACRVLHLLLRCDWKIPQMMRRIMTCLVPLWQYNKQLSLLETGSCSSSDFWQETKLWHLC